MEYITMSQKFLEKVDCRMIQLELDFFLLTEVQLKNVAEIYLQYFGNLLDSAFITRWNWNLKNINKYNLQQKIKGTKEGYVFSFEADVINDVVFDVKSFREYSRKLDYSKCHYNLPSLISDDYIELFQQLIVDNPTPEQTKQAVLDIFNYGNKKMIAKWCSHDANGFFRCCSYRDHPKLFYGECSFRIGYNCLNKEVSKFVEELILLVINLSSAVVNVNARITLSPIAMPSSCSGHMLYFSGKILEDQSHISAGCRNFEWYPHYYSRGAEWFNLLSPLQATLVPNIFEDVKFFSDVCIIENDNKSVIVKSNKPIECLDVDDLMPVNRLLYNALYPGETHMFLSDFYNITQLGYMSKLRRRWEYVPVFEEEVEVLSDRILLRHQKKAARKSGDGL